MGRAGRVRAESMFSLSALRLEDWLPPLLTGLLFTTLGALKVIGRTRGVVGGGGKPWRVRAYGSCPTWSRTWNLFMTGLICAIGVGNLAWLALLCWRGER